MDIKLLENYSIWLIVVALITAILALVLSVLALLKALKALEKSREERIKYYAVDVKSNLLSIQSSVRTEVAKQLRQQTFSNGNVGQQPSNPVNVAQISRQESVNVDKSDNGPQSLFAGMCRDGVFKHITSTPDDKTIFTISLSRNDSIQGILDVDKNAYNKIALTPDYLQYACVYSGNGSQFKVIKSGVVIKESGVWTVKEPIMAEFI